ncbi:glutathione S-transferase [Meredithblackwellia eburnea MCA 4105]
MAASEGFTPKAGLNLLTTSTPNGIKISIALEELKAAGAIPGYSFTPISFAKNEQKSEWFLKINPNGRIPALVDVRDGKKTINIWESASILQYLAKTYDVDYNFHFKDEDDETEMTNWLHFLQGGVGPMQGQANHFNKYAPVKIQYGIDRYQNETRRLYSVYEKQLKGKDFLVGEGKGKFSYADIVSFPWIRSHDWAGVSVDEFPNIAAWLERIENRPAVIAGLKIPEQDSLTKMKADPELAAKVAKEASAWIMKGVADDAKK